MGDFEREVAGICEVLWVSQCPFFIVIFVACVDIIRSEANDTCRFGGVIPRDVFENAVFEAFVVGRVF